jgi:hypothetical protein
LSGTVTPSWHFLHARAITFDDPELPHGIATAFPAHWTALFALRDWSMTIDA